MRRRSLLRATAGTLATVGLVGPTGLTGSLAGLPLSGSPDGADSTGAGPPAPGGSDDAYPALAETGVPATVCEESTQPWALLEIVDPAFGDGWPDDVDSDYGDDGRLRDDAVVIGRTGGNRPRAYPISILWRHEVCEDEYGGEPSLVTYCSLCQSGMVTSRVVADESTEFRATGLLWRPEAVFTDAAEADDRSFGVTGSETDVDVRNQGNLVLVDAETGSYWSQLLARAICGPREGTALDVLPSSTATWGAFRRDHTDAEVLLPPPWSGLDETGRERRS